MTDLSQPRIKSVGTEWCHLPVDRDLANRELWERSLQRSLRRRALAAQAHKTRVTKAQVSAALITTTVVAPIAPAVAQTPTTLLKRGSEGGEVATIQRALGIPADGVFGPQTRRAVKAFQSAHGLEVDGVVGPQTLGALGISGGGGGVSHGSAVAAAQSKLGAPYAL